MTTVDTQIIQSQVKNMTDERLGRELAFAEAFSKESPDPSPNADVWLAALRAEKAART